MIASLAVVASGMVTALGYNAPASLAALRAGISSVAEIPWVDFESGEPLRGAKVSLPQWWEGVGKLAELVSPAIYECLEAAKPESMQNIPILLGVAETDRPGRFKGIDDQLLEEINFRLELPLHPESKVFSSGQTSCAHALVEANRILKEGRARACIVTGVDSYLHQPTLDVYIDRRRIMTPSNSNGFFPGEGGCALLVTKPGAVDREELRILGFGLSHESAHINSTEPLRANGLTRAIKDALNTARVALKDVAYRLTDLSGEHYKFKEAAFAVGRLNSGEREIPLDLWHPIEYLGELGAAILPCLLAQAMHATQQFYAPGPLALCHVGNDAGERVAMIVGLYRNGKRVSS